MADSKRNIIFPKLLIGGWFKSHPFFFIENIYFLFIIIKRDFYKYHKDYGRQH